MTTNEPLPSFDWILGFIEAEGSLTYSTEKCNTYPKFCMTQRNREILKKIIKVLPVETKVYECKDNFFRLSFKGEDKILSMIRFLDGRLHTQYAKQRLEEWKEIYRDAYGPNCEIEIEYEVG